MYCQSRKNLKHLILKNQNIYHICSSATIPTVASVSLNSQFHPPPTMLVLFKYINKEIIIMKIHQRKGLTKKNNNTDSLKFAFFLHFCFPQVHFAGCFLVLEYFYMVHFSLEPNKSEHSCLICSGRIHLAPSRSHRFALGLHHAGPIKTIYLMCVGLDTITSLHAIVHLHFHFIYLFILILRVSLL